MLRAFSTAAFSASQKSQGMSLFTRMTLPRPAAKSCFFSHSSHPSLARHIRPSNSMVPSTRLYPTLAAHRGASFLGFKSSATPFFASNRSGGHSYQQTRAMSNALQRFAGNFSVDRSNKVVYCIMAINIAVFATWQYAEANLERFQDGRLYHFMFRNFTDSTQNLKEGRVWTLLTSAFSHKEWYHIILNSMVLLSFGDPVWRLLGTRRFLAVYLGSAVASSLSSALYYSHLGPYLCRLQDKSPSRVNNIKYSLGASGSLFGLITANACVNPMSVYSLFFVINVPAYTIIAFLGGYELYNVLAVKTGQFDSAAHLGGGMFGAAYYWVRLRPIIRRMMRR